MNSVLSQIKFDTDLARICFKQSYANACILDRKQKDYGPDNLIRHGTFGVIVRSDDKLSRLLNLTKQSWKHGVTSPSVMESLADTWSDLANYALIGQVMELGVWPCNQTPAADAQTNRKADQSSL